MKTSQWAAEKFFSPSAVAIRLFRLPLVRRLDTVKRIVAEPPFSIPGHTLWPSCIGLDIEIIGEFPLP